MKLINSVRVVPLKLVNFYKVSETGLLKPVIEYFEYVFCDFEYDYDCGYDCDDNCEVDYSFCYKECGDDW